MKIGIVVHGRVLDTVGWEDLVWGKPPHKLGALPMMALVALNSGVENIEAIIFGSGASEKDGLTDAEYSKRFLLEHMAELGEFERIQAHSRFQSHLDLVLFEKLSSKIICDTKSQNTEEEVANAAKIFSDLSVDEVKQVACGSHAMRCQKVALIARKAGKIPNGQLWSCYGDDTSYAGSKVEDVFIIEPPHRGDDPMLGLPVQAYQVFPKFFKITSTKGKQGALKAILDIIKNS